MTEGEAGGHSGYDTLATASGMSAIHLFYLQMRYMTGKNEIVLCPAVYGGVYHHLVDHLQKASGFVVHVMKNIFPKTWKQYVNEHTIAIHIETPSNPCADIFDIIEYAKLAEETKTMLVVDNTIGTYALQRPLLVGADAVINSVTKAVNGKTLAEGGTITAGADIMKELRMNIGTGIRPVMDSRVAEVMLKGLKNLPERMERFSENALFLAGWLEQHPYVKRVLYPGLSSNPHYKLAKRQMPKGCGGLLAFEVHGGKRGAWETLNYLKKVIHAPHIGHTKTLAVHPHTTTHSKIPPDMQDLFGITPELIRVSSGTEGRRELAEVKQDIDRALTKAHKK
jgi:O-succinylhomoserine sulfhydrylase